jgi:sigma-B regulation protein RsbU (phosphoserine phosphatase)
MAPIIPGYELALRYRPACFATGDYYDFFPREYGGSVFIGDGSGHGPTACVLMAMMRAILQTHPEIHADPGQTLASAGQMFKTLIASDLFMTGVYLELRSDGVARWASAGHHPPIRVDRHGNASPRETAAIGLPLGVEPDEQYQTVDWRLQPGDRVVLFTDGLVEARNDAGVPFGRNRVETVASELISRPLDEAIGELLARAEGHLRGADFEDDFTLIGIEYNR